MNSTRGRGTKKWKREKVRHRRRTTIFQDFRKTAVLTPHGTGVVLNDTNKYGFRQFIIKLDNGKVGFFSQSDIFDILTCQPLSYGNFTRYLENSKPYYKKKTVSR